MASGILQFVFTVMILTRIASPGDTLVSVRAPVGDINMASERCCIGRGLSTIRHKSGSRSYTYYSMLSLKDVFAQFEAEGTIFGAINKNDFASIEFIVAPAEIVMRFEDIANSLDQEIENNEKESLTLVSIRDSMLPRLISGKLKVNDGKITGGAA